MAEKTKKAHTFCLHILAHFGPYKFIHEVLIGSGNISEASVSDLHIDSWDIEREGVSINIREPQ